VYLRPYDSLINICYRFSTPTNAIFVSTSEKESRDVINLAPLSFVKPGSGKISHIYSLSVKQYALTKEAYTYWYELKKNTQQLGTIFDAQPSTINGNIHCVNNPAETVIGFISVSTMTSKKVFFQNFQLPYYLPFIVPYPGAEDCVDSHIYFEPLNTFGDRFRHALFSRDSLLVDYLYDDNGNTIGYRYQVSICVDCRLQGGTTIKPSDFP
jgi:hypothetical protein